jgi:hypothetical protein
MNDKQRRKWCMVISYVKGNCLAMKLLKIAVIGVIDEYKLLNLCHVNIVGTKQTIQTYIREEADKECMSIEGRMVVWTKQEAITWFMMWLIFNIFRYPTMVFKVRPLCLFSLAERIRLT